MDFISIAQTRQFCRNFDPARPLPQQALDAVLQAAQLAPSACNGQPWHITVCSGSSAARVASACTGMGMNRFAADAPVMLVLSEKPYVRSAAAGAKLKHNDYRSMDIGIAVAYLTAEAQTQGLGSCILGWFDDKKVRAVCGLPESEPVRLVVALGYPAAGDPLRKKVRKPLEELVTYLPADEA